jgi:TonB family protein
VNRSRPVQFVGLPNQLLLILALVLSTSVVTLAQEPAVPVASPSASVETAKPLAASTDAAQAAPTDSARSSEVLQARIERARALIAAHRLDVAASELESVRAMAQDNAFRNITSIMLMNVYLEEGNYGRAEALLEETFKSRSAKEDSLGNFFALAGQAVNGARLHLARYRTFGISTNNETLPPEAVSDLDRLRSLLERMVAQAKEISSARRAYDSLSLLEDVLGLRLSLAKDSEDQIKWEAEYATARESLASSQTQIASLGGIPPLRPGRTPVKNNAAPSPYSTKKTTDSPLSVKPVDKDHASATSPSGDVTPTNQPVSVAKPAEQPSTASPAEPEVTDAGSLNAKATRKVVPRYPAFAKQSGAAGLVRVHVLVDEAGRVISVSRSEGPMLLRAAAEEAARQWAFEVRKDGRPTRLSGYIDFNFAL